MKPKYNHLKVFWSIFDDKNINAQEKLVLLAILRFAGEDNRAWPSYDHLATSTGLSRSTVIRNIRSLSVNKYIFKSDAIRNKNNRYSLNIVKILNKLGSVTETLGGVTGTLGSVTGTPQEVSGRHLKNNTRSLHDKSVCSDNKKESQNVQVVNASADAALSPLTATKKGKELADDDPLADHTNEQLKRMLKSPLASRIIALYGSHPRILAIMDRSNKKDVTPCNNETHWNK